MNIDELDESRDEVVEKLTKALVRANKEVARLTRHILRGNIPTNPRTPACLPNPNLDGSDDPDYPWPNKETP